MLLWRAVQCLSALGMPSEFSLVFLMSLWDFAWVSAGDFKDKDVGEPLPQH